MNLDVKVTADLLFQDGQSSKKATEGVLLKVYTAAGDSDEWSNKYSICVHLIILDSTPEIDSVRSSIS
jgi:hypothetical protein